MMSNAEERERQTEELAERVRRLDQRLTERDTTIAGQQAEISRLRNEQTRGR